MKEPIRLRILGEPVRYDLAGLLKLARAVREYAPEEKMPKKTAGRKKRVDNPRNGVKTAMKEHGASSWTTYSTGSGTNFR